MRSCVVFIFRRDLRCDDNNGLQKAIISAKNNDCKLIVCFEFHEEQLKGDYFGNNSFQFMLESLKDLQSSLHNKLGYYYKKKNDINIIERLTQQYNIKEVFSNKDYTPYATKRDSLLKDICDKLKIPCTFVEDYTLHPLNTVYPKGKKTYSRFTPFYDAIKVLPVDKVKTISEDDKDLCIRPSVLETSFSKLSFQQSKEFTKNIFGGRKLALECMKNIDFKSYPEDRNIPIKDITTKMGAYLKFGCVSVREFYWYIIEQSNKSHELIRQLFWKEFYANITFTFPQILDGMISTSKNKPFNSKELPWESKGFDKWCNGETGFPFVDAGMRQLNQTGFMHNRVRMIVASFLIKDLHIDWRKGEKYFATMLTDYDPASNNGGWQWCAGTGTDAQPYHRIFNPWTQTERFDPECEYILKWIPELSSIPIKDILKWDTNYNKHPNISYPKPMIDHSVERQKSLDMMKKTM
jgi:deoxyribodipyrimidine photo-lyase